MMEGAGTADDPVIMTGWEPEQWAHRLRQMAGVAATINPDRAKELIEWAEAVEAKVLREQSQPPPSSR